jgi:hypothetical protein
MFGDCEPSTVNPETSEVVLAITAPELQAMFALYFDSMDPFIKSRKMINFAKTEGYGFISEGNLQKFCAVCARRVSALTEVSRDIMAIMSITPRGLMQICEKVANLPVGEYAYDIPVGDVLDPIARAQHRAVLVRSDGLTMEVSGYKELKAVSARPTSFVTFLERAVARKDKFNNGIYYQKYDKVFPQKFILQRAIQMTGAWDYNVVSQNCVTFTRWVCNDKFLCVVGDKTRNKAIGLGSAPIWISV